MPLNCNVFLYLSKIYKCKNVIFVNLNIPNKLKKKTKLFHLLSVINYQTCEYYISRSCGPVYGGTCNRVDRVMLVYGDDKPILA